MLEELIYYSTFRLQDQDQKCNIPGKSGQHEADSQEVGQPEVVGGDRGVLLGLNLGLVHETPSCFAS